MKKNQKLSEPDSPASAAIKPKDDFVGFRIPESVKHRLSKRAALNNRRLSQEIRKIVCDALTADFPASA